MLNFAESEFSTTTGHKAFWDLGSNRGLEREKRKCVRIWREVPPVGGSANLGEKLTSGVELYVHLPLCP